MQKAVEILVELARFWGEERTEPTATAPIR
jgi:hypothetical protein